jgi:hypothetical protein
MADPQCTCNFIAPELRPSQVCSYCYRKAHPLPKQEDPKDLVIQVALEAGPVAKPDPATRPYLTVQRVGYKRGVEVRRGPYDATPPESGVVIHHEPPLWVVRGAETQNTKRPAEKPAEDDDIPPLEPLSVPTLPDIILCKCLHCKRAFTVPRTIVEYINGIKDTREDIRNVFLPCGHCGAFFLLSQFLETN